MSTGVAIPGDRNVIKKEGEKILKHKDFIIDLNFIGFYCIILVAE